MVDPKTMRIKKEVVGVAPVIWEYQYLEDANPTISKTIAFVAYFQKPKQNDFDIAYVSESVPLDSVALRPERELFNNHAYYQFEHTNIDIKKLYISNITKNKVKFH